MEENFRRLLGIILMCFSAAGFAEAWADDVEEGRAAIKAGRYESAFRLLLPKAGQGNAEAQNAVGVLYRNGWGVKQDFSEAVEWFRKAAAQGNLWAQVNIGQMYGQGQGVKRDSREEEKWYRGAAEQGFPPAQTLLGAMYATGSGVPQGWAEAMRWYRKAADQGDATAQSRVGLMYAEAQGIPKDYTKAEQWYRKAALQQHPAGQAGLGVLYLNGWGVKRDVAEATKWLRLAAEQEAPDAQYHLGSIFAKEKDGTPEAVDSIMWLRRAAMYGHVEARKLLEKRFDTEPEQGPILVHLEQIIRVPSVHLAESYLAVSFAAKILEPARLGRFRATFVTRLDNREDTITASNAALYLAGYQDRLRVYGSTISRRGYESIAGTYSTRATASCGRVQSIWAGGIREGVLGDVNISQDGFNAKLVNQAQTEGKSFSVEIPGIVAESVLAFSDPANSEFGFHGQITPGQIIVRPNLKLLDAWPNWVKAPSRKDLSECVVTLSRIQS